MTDVIPPEDDGVMAAARDAYVSVPHPAPAGIVDTAMRTVVVDLRPARRLAVPGGFVTDTAAANAVRLVLDGDPAVIARRCRVELDADGWRVGLSVAVSYAHYDRHGDAAIRSRVRDAVVALFGAPVGHVDIDVVDVFIGGIDRPRTDAS